MTEDNTLRGRIRKEANKKGLSLPDLEKALGIGSGTIARWKTSSPGADKLLMVSDYLEVSLDYLVRGYDFVPNGPASEKEYDLIEYFRKLNAEGQANLLNYVSFLAGQEKYICPAAADH